MNKIAKENHIQKVKHIALEVGELSGFVPQYLTKLFPVAVDRYPILQKAELQIRLIAGKGLHIKEIGY
ncbi:MAG: hydrogenase maturation nickel metallochaperone HypA [Firmicutes bacterium]|nr:hydrogenase maturation nickel metallochaperone HypA [Bacillota bacterium]